MTSVVNPPSETPEANHDTIAVVAPTLAALFGIDPPVESDGPPLDGIVQAGRSVFRATPAERCLVYLPDALGMHLLQPLPQVFEPVQKVAPLEVRLRSVSPSKTPVCFASMFTGAPPEVHGIRRYERPVLRCDTLFDALLRAGKRVAIVAVAGSSMDLIFRERAMDYFSEDYDPEVTEVTLGLLDRDHHDLIVTYHQEYDDLLHETTPLKPRALRAAQNHITAFRTLATAANVAWQRHHRIVLLAPDHGACLDPTTRKGTHGGDTPDEMDVAHFWGFKRGRRVGRGASRDREDPGSI